MTNQNHYYTIYYSQIKLYLDVQQMYDLQRCKETCSRHKAMRPSTGLRYILGQKRCQVCQIFIIWEGLFCPCCGGRLRNKPKRSKYKQKVMMLNMIAKN
jgi:hypothetical protein